MKKIFTIAAITIITLIVTFFIAEIFSLYSFGTLPTLLTTLYLITIFSIFEYLFLTTFYIVKKLIKKEKISLKRILALVLLFIALILILGYLIILDIDYLHRYMYSAPYYLNVISRSIEFLLPATILIIVSIFLMKKKEK